MKKTILSITVLLLLTNIVSAQQKDSKTELSGHNIGLYAGASAGYGLSYRYFKNKLGIQVVTAPMLSSEMVALSLGVTGLVSIKQYNRIQFYSYLGNHFNFYSSEDDVYIEGCDAYTKGNSCYETQNVQETYNVTGAGVGFELIAGKHIAFNWQVGYAFYYTDQNDWRTFLDGAFGVMFKF